MDTKEKVEGGLKLAKIITEAKVYGVILVAILVGGGCFCYAESQPGKEINNRVGALEVKVDGIASQLQLITELLKQR